MMEQEAAQRNQKPKEIAQSKVNDGDTPTENAVTRGRIAVIEDGEATRYFLVQCLRAHGYYVKGIEDGASAIPLLRTHQPDVILLDVQLPGLNGFEVCKLIRKDPLLRDARVILLTGRAGAQDRMAGWSAGADDYLIKPCEIPEVLARVAAHLRHREAPQQQWLNPITLLPAPARLEDELQARVQRGESFGACFADVAHFKSYNDRYGYQAGDALLAVLADLLREIVQELNAHAHAAGTPPTSMVGHLGSDDFLLITPPEQVLEASALVVQRFGEVAPSLYRSIDRERGWIPGVDRAGMPQNFPLVALTVATLVRHPGDIAGAEQIGALPNIAAELWRQLRSATQPTRP
jgi:PleD family two-component response regulator